MKARAIVPPRRVITKKGNLEYLSIWEVAPSKHCPEGICYSFQLISKDKRVLGYDNNTGEGHHRHYLKNGKLVKESIKFKNWIEFLSDL